MNPVRTGQRAVRLVMGLPLAFAVLPAWALNDCFDADFVDRRGRAELVVANDDPTNLFRYRPRCATVSEGTRIVFRANPNFGMHPLYGGLVSGGVATIDPSSPIGSINSGTEEARTLTAAGEFPFFCDFHYAQGMLGSLRVVPTLFADGFD